MSIWEHTFYTLPWSLLSRLFVGYTCWLVLPSIVTSPVPITDSPFSLLLFVFPTFNFGFVTANGQWEKRFRTYRPGFRNFPCQPIRSFILLNTAMPSYPYYSYSTLF